MSLVVVFYAGSVFHLIKPTSVRKLLFHKDSLMQARVFGMLSRSIAFHADTMSHGFVAAAELTQSSCSSSSSRAKVKSRVYTALCECEYAGVLGCDVVDVVG